MMKNIILFIIPTFIFGTTWFAIKFQLGTVDPMVSIMYRYAIASLLFFAWCKIRKLNLKYTLKQHFLMFLQAVCMFSFNFWLIYLAEMSLKSGLVSIFFSLIIITNILFYSLFLKAPFKPLVIVGAIIGLTGTYMIFKNEFISFSVNDSNFIALLFCLITIILVSLGNILSAYFQRNKMLVLSTNSYGMLYGSVIMFTLALITGKEFSFDAGFAYTASLFYLVIFGSVIGTSCYLIVLGRIGPDRSAYMALIIPVLAMIVSTIFEDYIWQKSAIFGIVLLLAGNFIAFKSKNIKLNLTRKR